MEKIRLKAIWLVVAVLTFISTAGLWAEEEPKEEIYTPDPAITAMIASNPTLIEDKLKTSIINEIKNPASVTVDITHISPEDTALGKFKRVFVTVSRGEIEECVIDSAKIEFLDVQLNTKRLIEEDKIKPINKCNINMDVLVKESDLNAFLAGRAKKIKVDNPKVKMIPGNLELSGSTKYGFVKVEFWAKGNFNIKDKKEIWFHASKMKVNRISMPRNFVGAIVKKINPVLKFSKFSFNVNVEAINITNDEMRMTSFPDGHGFE